MTDKESTMVPWKIEMIPPKLAGYDLKVYQGTDPRTFVEKISNVIGAGFEVRVRYGKSIFWGKCGRACDWAWDNGFGDWIGSYRLKYLHLFLPFGWKKKAVKK